MQQSMGTRLGTSRWPRVQLGQSCPRSRQVVYRRVSIESYRDSKVPVRFEIKKKVKFGEQIKIVGNQPFLGQWKADGALELKWAEGDVWVAEVDVPVGEDIEFKCLRCKEDKVHWEDGNNRTFKAWGPEYGLKLDMEWGNTEGTIIEAAKLPEGATGSASAPAPPVTSFKEAVETPHSSDSEEGEVDLRSSGVSSDDDAPSRVWHGGDVKFMRRNEHSKERQGVWDKSGLTGATLRIVEGDEKAASWLQKLSMMKSVLVDEAPRLRPSESTLTPAYVYLQWVSTGAIPCVEGGGHYRPNHHANLAQLMFRSLEWAIEEAPGKCKTQALVARRLQTKIPSFDKEFTASVPLTRIRDIAHRSDIPHELKQEIKHTLQNKLHRNAGPEDLIATEEMLKRITAKPGQFNDNFIREFKLFHEELKDFFNASSLTSLLEDIKNAMQGDPQDSQLLDRFFTAKSTLDQQASPSANQIMDVLHSVTTVRALLVSGLQSGLRNDAPDASMSMRQKWRLAEIRSEDYFFVILSRFINLLEEKGGPSWLSRSSDSEWALPIGSLVLGLRHLALDYWDPAECAQIESELTAWQKEGKFRERDSALRLKSTLERINRLAEGFTESLIAMFSEPSRTLGRALGVAEYARSIFTEAEVRASVVFQLSKLNLILLKAVRLVTGAGEWDPLVAGTATGRLVRVRQLTPESLTGLSEEVVLLVDEADGDEELAAAGRQLQGVILCQGLPHLSHLGVRARQEKVIFATLEDTEVLEKEVKPLVGKQVTLEVTPERALVRLASDQEVTEAKRRFQEGLKAPNGRSPSGNGSTPPLSSLESHPVNKVTDFVVYGMMDCTVDTCGAKAAACGTLEQVACRSQDGVSFSTPDGCGVPFGVMDLAIKLLSKQEQEEFNQLLTATESASLQDLEETCQRLQDITRKLQLPAAFLKKVRDAFSSPGPLICRSSANVEDLAGLSGAGLYDSIPNIRLDDDEDLRRGITGVWASLFTRRAVLSRRSAGVPQSSAVMGVLIQRMLAPQYSFVIHSVSPLTRDLNVAQVEMALGLGETLAAGTRGTPWRLEVNKKTGKVNMQAFANFSDALLGSSQKVTSVSAAPAGAGARYSRSSGSFDEVQEQPTYRMVPLDYSKARLSVDGDYQQALGAKIGAVAVCLEREFGSPQDIEGCVVDDQVYVVQSRPQP